MKQGRKRNRRERKKDNKYEESKLYLIWLRILFLPAGFFENINTFNEKREDKTKRKRNLERRKFQNEANQ
jgi:hypothetical protein